MSLLLLDLSFVIHPFSLPHGEGWGEALQKTNGPWPVHDVVVSAVRNAVRAATTIFATTSRIRSFFMVIIFFEPRIVRILRMHVHENFLEHESLESLELGGTLRRVPSDGNGF